MLAVETNPEQGGKDALFTCFKNVVSESVGPVFQLLY